jgi:hypothetical protein
LAVEENFCIAAACLMNWSGGVQEAAHQSYRGSDLY